MWLSDWFKNKDEALPDSAPPPRILGVALPIDDCVSLRWLAEQHRWDLRLTQSPRDAFRVASESHFEIILCDRNQPGHPWREVMERLAKCSPRSCILLVSPMNGDELWQSVLQNGGYDVLRQPLRENSTLRAIHAALRFISGDLDIPAELSAAARK